MHTIPRCRSMKAILKHPLILGTLLLTGAGLATRLIGFFYRIYLSRLFGEHGMGIYQLVTPILFLSFSLTSAGFQTAISKITAEYCAQQKSTRQVLYTGMRCSVLLSLLCAGIVFCFSEAIAARFLSEPLCAPLLRVLAFSIVPGTIHACVNGYFYGLKKAVVPASSQLLEQLVRVLGVWLLASRLLSVGKTPSVSLAILGITLGECASMLYSVLAIQRQDNAKPSCAGTCTRSDALPLYRSILAMAAPLTANRLALNILQSLEAVSIPAALRLYGYDNATSLSIYGVFTGMALPFLFFPNALTGSVSVLLLPIISEQNAAGDTRAVRRATAKCICACVSVGLLCMFAFLLSGRFLGNFLFHSELAGYFITMLSFTCPFLYLNTTLSAIIQGLGRAGTLFSINLACLLLRLGFVLVGIPKLGVKGCAPGLFVSQLAMTILYLSVIRRIALRS